jgi:4-azaleucine resistance transporter AzlC
MSTAASRGQALRYAFVQTVPVLFGYVFLGLAFGLLLQRAGYSFLWALLISTIVYAGSMQFVLISVLAGGIGLLPVALLTLSINSRHIFYGLSFLQKFRAMGRAFPYMIFSLTDETYSLLCSVRVPEALDQKRVLFWIALLNQCYWVAGSVAGALGGQLIKLDATGIDFAMTALFTVIFVEQWLANRSHLPAIIGAGSGLICLVIFGADRFILPALLLAVALLLLIRPILARKEAMSA